MNQNQDDDRRNEATCDHIDKETEDIVLLLGTDSLHGNIHRGIGHHFPIVVNRGAGGDEPAILRRIGNVSGKADGGIL